tara:strand:+ start:2257 stop:3129 length:873 start_codon:yes stop_codon:yes gene_type:complete
MSYLEQVIKASGGHAAPMENLEEKIPEGYHRMPDGTIMKDSEHQDEAAIEKEAGDPCWEGYVQLGTKMKSGKRVPNCVPIGEAQTLTESPTPALSASGGVIITFSEEVESGLEEKVLKHNSSFQSLSDRQISVKTLKAVYRRGAETFSATQAISHNRSSWAMKRVDAFLHLSETGSPTNSAYSADNDLLPAGHSQGTMSDSSALTAAGYDEYLDSQVEVKLLPKDEYSSVEQTIFTLAEYSGLGYDVIPSIRAAWARGIKSGENPFERASSLAIQLYGSQDADLLPKREN